ncbi:MAG: hypothetical protein JST39_10095, partial [Bacteroidetes bacterium]|nr:hypothetical protein [Bacteroidota bacterium]
MKKLFARHKVLLTFGLLLVAAGAFAGDNDGEKQKTYTKSYPLGKNDRIHINNQFGQVKILTWDKSEVKADITITTRSSSDEDAQKLLDGINIQDGRNADGVFFKTVLPKNTNNTNHGIRKEGDWDKDRDRNRDRDKEREDKDRERKDRKGNTEGMNIDYVITLPASSPLFLENQFGKSIIPNLSGPVEIVHKFGDLVAGNLSNVKSLQVEFGKATVESINNGKVTVKFSEASVKKLSGAIKASFEFSDKVNLPLDNDVTDFSLNNSYSSIKLTISPNFSGDFDIHTNFGDFKNSTQLPIKEMKDENDDHGPKFDRDFSGKSGSGACKVKIKSSFG